MLPHDTLGLIDAIAGIATALGVSFAAAQLLLAKRQAATDFEDHLAKEYRDTIRRIPVDALLGAPLQEQVLTTHLADFYHYVDLTNEQVFLRLEGRVRRETWENWKDGIRSNLAKPAFAAAWDRIKAGSVGSFEELRLLEAHGFDADPRDWRGLTTEQKHKLIDTRLQRLSG